ncbi:MAG: hypothetical protein SV760_02965, partial [Halobacteria archaeon]|nr:hypothetical protein [Halobacteria archaeon]
MNGDAGLLNHVLEHHLGDLPDELIELRKMPDDIWDDVPDPIEEQVVEQVGDEPVYRMFSLVDDNVREALPDYLRELLIEAEELFDENPTYAEIPDELSDEIRSILPEHLDSLLYQLEEFVDEEGNVHAFMAIEDGEVIEIDVLDSP